MPICITTNTIDPSSIYPVIDPRRTAGPGPYQYVYTFAWDLINITVTRLSGLSSCTMIVNFASTLSEAKEIQAWNIFNNNSVDQIGSSLPSSMTIQKANCEAGADTLQLCRIFAWPRGRTALYSFPPNDFWDFWGGCAVTFNWVSDTISNGHWGNQVPQPTYPQEKLADGTVMRDMAGSAFVVAFGGAGFAADLNFLAMSGLSNAPVLPFSPLPATPADFTLIREVFDIRRRFVVFGGAKFLIPWLVHHFGQVPFTFAFGIGQVHVIPPGGAAQLRTVPIDGTLLREQNDPKVFLVENGQLRWVVSPQVMDSACLQWRHVRIVPDRALAALPMGPNVT